MAAMGDVEDKVCDWCSEEVEEGILHAEVICSRPNCGRRYYHQCCLEDHLRKNKVPTNRLCGFPCPRGQGRKSTAEPCSGRVESTHKKITKNKAKKAAAAQPWVPPPRPPPGPKQPKPASQVARGTAGADRAAAIKAPTASTRRQISGGSSNGNGRAVQQPAVKPGAGAAARLGLGSQTKQQTYIPGMEPEPWEAAVPAVHAGRGAVNAAQQQQAGSETMAEEAGINGAVGTFSDDGNSDGYDFYDDYYEEKAYDNRSDDSESEQADPPDLSDMSSYPELGRANTAPAGPEAEAEAGGGNSGLAQVTSEAISCEHVHAETAQAVPAGLAQGQKQEAQRGQDAEAQRGHAGQPGQGEQGGNYGVQVPTGGTLFGVQGNSEQDNPPDDWEALADSSGTSGESSAVRSAAPPYSTPLQHYPRASSVPPTGAPPAGAPAAFPEQPQQQPQGAADSAYDAVVNAYLRGLRPQDLPEHLAPLMQHLYTEFGDPAGCLQAASGSQTVGGPQTAGGLQVAVGPQAALEFAAAVGPPPLGVTLQVPWQAPVQHAQQQQLRMQLQAQQQVPALAYARMQAPAQPVLAHVQAQALAAVQAQVQQQAQQLRAHQQHQHQQHQRQQHQQSAVQAIAAFAPQPPHPQHQHQRLPQQQPLPQDERLAPPGFVLQAASVSCPQLQAAMPPQPQPQQKQKKVLPPGFVLQAPPANSGQVQQLPTQHMQQQYVHQQQTQQRPVGLSVQAPAFIPPSPRPLPQQQPPPGFSSQLVPAADGAPVQQSQQQRRDQQPAFAGLNVQAAAFVTPQKPPPQQQQPQPARQKSAGLSVQADAFVPPPQHDQVQRQASTGRAAPAYVPPHLRQRQQQQHDGQQQEAQKPAAQQEAQEQQRQEERSQKHQAGLAVLEVGGNAPAGMQAEKALVASEATGEGEGKAQDGRDAAGSPGSVLSVGKQGYRSTDDGDDGGAAERSGLGSGSGSVSGSSNGREVDEGLFDDLLSLCLGWPVPPVVGGVQRL